MGSRQHSTWRQKLQVSKPASSSRGPRVSQSRVRIAGSMDTARKHRPHVQQPQAQKEEITWKTVTFEGLSGVECRTWWDNTPDAHFLKGQLRRAGVHWAIQMPLPSIREYEGPLRGMIDTFDRDSRRSTLKYCGTEIQISFSAQEISRVFGIPGMHGKKIDLKPRKLSREEKEKYIKLVSRNLSQSELESLAGASSKNRGIKKSFVAPGEWRCLMDIVKSRLTGASRASDIALTHLIFMNGIRNGTVYDWASVMAERLYEFMTLQHRTFYMPHIAIGLFLNAAREQILAEKLRPQPVDIATGEPLIFHWRHLDAGGVQTGSKRKRQVLSESEGENVDSGQEESSEDLEEEEGSESVAVGDSDTLDTEVPSESAFAPTPPSESAPPLVLFTPPVPSATVAAGTSVPFGTTLEAVPMPRFGELRPPVVLHPAGQASEPPTAQPTDPGQTSKDGVGGLEQEQTQPREQVTLDVVGTEAIVRVGPGVLEEPARALPTGDEDSSVLSWLEQFTLPPIAVAAPISLSPARVVLERPSEVIDLDAVMSPPREEPVAQEREISERPVPMEGQRPQAEASEEPPALPGSRRAVPARESAQKVLEQYLADVAAVAAGAQRVIASAELQAQEGVAEELERLLTFVRVGCPQAFAECFEARGWPTQESLTMLEDWALSATVGESRIHGLIRELEQAFREEYFTLRRLEHASSIHQATGLAAEAAREEAASRLTALETAVVQERESWVAERSTMVSELDTLRAALETERAERALLETRLGSALETVDAKEKAVLEAASMVRTAMELKMRAEQALQLRTTQVYELRAKVTSGTATAAPSSSGTLPTPPPE